MTHYLRVEAMNLSAFLDDTKDVSAVRGGGLLLLDAIEDLSRLPGLEALSTGASVGLFGIAPGHDPQRVRTAALQRLHTGGTRHTTFVADVLPSTGDFVRDRERLLAANRWQQLAAPSLAMPSLAPDSREPCELDGVRPATRLSPKAGRNWNVSASVQARREHGRDAKQGFYKKLLGADLTRPFSQDLEDLSDDAQRGNLHHKIAILYADGNGFGAIQERLCRDRKSQRRFDTVLKKYRRQFMASLLREPVPAFLDAKGRVRFETLQWGGDEFLIVVPAWLGYWVLGRFFEQAARWRLWPGVTSQPLFHGAGLVFCHHAAPLHRVRALAKELAELAKDQDRGANLFAYEVLESFDHAGNDLAGYRRRRWSRPEELILRGDAMLDLLRPAEAHAPSDTPMAVLREVLPRRRLHAIADELRRLGPEATLDLFGWPSARDLAREVPAAADAARPVLQALGGRPVAWLHLLELWDFLEGA
jgi:hypothetical protein